MYSTRRKVDNDPALKEFSWLSDQLQKAKQKNKKVWIITHIPPGDNTYNTLSENKYDGQWKDSYTKRLIDLMRIYAPIITAGFGGHTHVDDFRILQDEKAPEDSLGVFRIGPSVSPIFKNNDEGQFANVSMHYCFLDAHGI